MPLAPPMPVDSDALPYRGTFGEPRPAALGGLALPPRPMPSHHLARPLKSWRYVGVYGSELMLCLAQVRIGRGRQTFWALWDRDTERLHQRTVLGSGGVRLRRGGAQLRTAQLSVDIALDEVPGVEVIAPAGDSYSWTRKQAPVRATVAIEQEDVRRSLEAWAVIDDTAAYYPRHTRWRWSAGVGHSSDGATVAWNLVSGVNDPVTSSERTVWIDGHPREVGPCRFSEDLRSVDDLRFSPEATLAHRQNLLVLRSDYRQPFGTFSGRLPGQVELSEGYGVMEEHDAWW